MAEDTKENNQLVKAKSSSLQKISSNIVSRGLSDLVLLDSDKTQIADEWVKKGVDYPIRESDKAIAAFTSVIVIDPNSVDAYYNRGLRYHWLGQSDRAIEDFNKTIALNPIYVNAYYKRGNVYNYYMGQYDRAIEDYNKVIQLAPNDTCGYDARGEVYYKKGQYDSAIEDYNKVIQLDPDSTQAYYHRGIAYFRLGNKNMAISNLQKACESELEIACDDLQNILEGEEQLLQAKEWFDKGYYHHRINKEYDKEIEAYTNAISLDPNLAKAYAHRGNAYYEKGQYDRAIEDYNKTLGLNPYLTAVYNDRGLAYEMLGNKRMAISDFQKACDMGSKFGCENLKRVLEKK